MPVPIFLLSLPRSGSTLLQRILSSHADVASVAEPWLLLPMLYAIRPDGVFAEYSHVQSQSAMMDFLKELPHGKEDYLKAANLAASFLYGQAAKSNEKFFLDKTPRYALIASDVLDAFPDAKAIFLWRNPLAIAASMAETWGAGKWSLFRFKIDIYDGMDCLVSGFKLHRNRVLSVRYECLLSEPDRELKRISEYLGIDLDADALDRFSNVFFSGSKKDPTGMLRYSKLSSEPLNKWKASIKNPVRKYWCRRYLIWLGEDRLHEMGYSLVELLKELDEIKVGIKGILGDLCQFMYGMLITSLELTFFKRKYLRIKSWRGLHVHD